MHYDHAQVHYTTKQGHKVISRVPPVGRGININTKSELTKQLTDYTNGLDKEGITDWEVHYPHSPKYYSTDKRRKEQKTNESIQRFSEFLEGNKND